MPERADAPARPKAAYGRLGARRSRRRLRAGAGSVRATVARSPRGRKAPPGAESTRRRSPARLLPSGAVQRVLVTGARGFAGRHLTAALEQRGNVTIASRCRRARRRMRSRARSRRARPDAIAHLAGVASVADAWSREREVWDVNAIGTLNVVLAAERARAGCAAAGRVLGGGLRSRRRGGGPARRRTVPSRPSRPTAARRSQPRLACARDDIDVVVARPFPHTGPGPERDVRDPVVRRPDRPHRGRSGRPP